MRTFETTHQAYHAVIQELIYNPEFKSAPRGQPIREILHHQFSVATPSSAAIKTQSDERNARLDAYTRAEFELYARGARSVDDFVKASKFWGKLANPDGTVNSSYGYLIFYDRSCGNPDYEQTDASVALRTPWEWARLSLLEDADSRQAILKFHKRNHLWHGCKDQVCTIYGVFHIRVNKLFFAVRMRSNDVMRGLPYDLPWFCYLQHRMLDELRRNGMPELQLGSYTHAADSMHLYDRNLEEAYASINHSPQGELPTL